MIQSELLEGTQAVLGPDHLQCFEIMHNLALFVYNNGRAEEALEIIDKVVDGYKRYLPPDHRDMLTAVQDMGTIMGNLGRYDEAEPLLRDALSGYERTQGPDTTDTLRTVKNMVDLLQSAGRLDDARRFHLRYLKAIASKSSVQPAELRSSAASCFSMGDYELAERFLRRVLEQRFEIPGTHCHLARALVMQGRTEDARQEIQQAWEHQNEAPAYVTPRILYFQLLFSYLDGTESASHLGRMKSSLQNDDSSMGWAMTPVLDHLKPPLSADTHALLTALVAALSDRTNLFRPGSVPCLA